MPLHFEEFHGGAGGDTDRSRSRSRPRSRPRSRSRSRTRYDDDDDDDYDYGRRSSRRAGVKYNHGFVEGFDTAARDCAQKQWDQQMQGALYGSANGCCPPVSSFVNPCCDDPDAAFKWQVDNLNRKVGCFGMGVTQLSGGEPRSSKSGRPAHRPAVQKRSKSGRPAVQKRSKSRRPAVQRRSKSGRPAVQKRSKSGRPAVQKRSKSGRHASRRPASRRPASRSAPHSKHKSRKGRKGRKGQSSRGGKKRKAGSSLSGGCGCAAPRKK